MIINLLSASTGNYLMISLYIFLLLSEVFIHYHKAVFPILTIENDYSYRKITMRNSVKQRMDDHSNSVLDSSISQSYRNISIVSTKSAPKLIIIPIQKKSVFPPPSKPVYDSGIVFYIYYYNGCGASARYQKDLLKVIGVIKSFDRKTKIAVVTNCNISANASLLDVIVLIHPDDVIKTKEKQWITRVLYNAYLPFNYSFILDTHVYPCKPNDVSDILHRFRCSQVDISISNRENIRDKLSGGGVLSKFGNRSHQFWRRVYELQVKRKNYDDQGPMNIVRKQMMNEGSITFRWLSSNWFYATNGVSDTGQFVGSGKCYRSSVVVTGRVRFVHGDFGQCALINVPNNKSNNRYRSIFWPRLCKTNASKVILAYSSKELCSFTSPFFCPSLDWTVDARRPSDHLFWYET